MLKPLFWPVMAILISLRSSIAQTVIPAPNGTYTVGMTILELKNKYSIQPYAPDVEVPDLMLSVFYPTNESETVKTPYMDPDTARFEGLAQAQIGLDTNAETFRQLSLQLAANGSKIAQPTSNGGWPVLIFGCALGTPRLFYSALLSQIASMGYVVISYDTPYDTDIVVYPDGRNITANETLNAVMATADPAIIQPFLTPDYNVRAQDASFIITSLNDTAFTASVIPGCESCLNTTRVGYFGHSDGGGTGATVLLNDTRVAGGIDFDGAVLGDVIKQGFDKPFMLMAVTGQTRKSPVMTNASANWAPLWANLRGPSFDLIFNNASHNTYTDWPLVFQSLNILPTNQSVLDNLQVTTLNATRSQHIITTYTVAFFDWLLKGASDDLLRNVTSDFPEISLDTGDTEVFSNGTVVGAVNGSVISRGSSSPSGNKNSATPGLTRGKTYNALGLLELLLAAFVGVIW